MGLLKAAMSSVKGVLADQWKEYFYCEAIPANILVTKGHKRNSGRSSNTKGSDNIITNGSVIAVANGQCMIIVDQGKVADLCAEPGEYIYDVSTEPSLFIGSLSQSILEVFQNIGKRFTFGGEPPKDQRIYYFNTKELIGNKYGTPNPIPFRVVDQNIGLDMDISIRCFGEYSYRITNPILFYANVCGNVGQDYDRSQIDSQLKTELLTALQPAFGKLSDMGIRYSALPAHTMEMAEALNEVLSQKWSQLRGVEIVSFGVSSVNASEEDEQMIKELQRSAVLGNAKLAAGHLTSAQAVAMQEAAKNQHAGPAMAFMNMGMVQNAGGVDAGSLFRMAQQQEQARQERQQRQQQTAAQAANTWTCACGAVNTGKFCAECGAKKPEPKADGWTCPTCGAVNRGKFCAECGTKKPAGLPQYQCDKCGWRPADPTKPPKFCPECGDPFDDGDVQ